MRDLELVEKAITDVQAVLVGPIYSQDDHAAPKRP
jgi:hypothetical protein